MLGSSKKVGARRKDRVFSDYLQKGVPEIQCTVVSMPETLLLYEGD